MGEILSPLTTDQKNLMSRYLLQTDYCERWLSSKSPEFIQNLYLEIENLHNVYVSAPTQIVFFETSFVTGDLFTTMYVDDSNNYSDHMVSVAESYVKNFSFWSLSAKEIELYEDRVLLYFKGLTSIVVRMTKDISEGKFFPRYIRPDSGLIPTPFNYHKVETIVPVKTHNELNQKKVRNKPEKVYKKRKKRPKKTN